MTRPVLLALALGIPVASVAPVLAGLAATAAGPYVRQFARWRAVRRERAAITERARAVHRRDGGRGRG